jgi:hypothetical protein
MLPATSRVCFRPTVGRSARGVPAVPGCPLATRSTVDRKISELLVGGLGLRDDPARDGEAREAEAGAFSLLGGEPDASSS